MTEESKCQETNKKGIKFINEKEYDEAISIFKELLEEDNVNKFRYQYNIGYCYYQKFLAISEKDIFKRDLSNKELKGLVSIFSEIETVWKEVVIEDNIKVTLDKLKEFGKQVKFLMNSELLFEYARLKTFDNEALSINDLSITYKDLALYLENTCKELTELLKNIEDFIPAFQDDKNNFFKELHPRFLRSNVINKTLSNIKKALNEKNSDLDLAFFYLKEACDNENLKLFAPVFDMMGLVFYELRCSDEALNFFNKAIILNKNNPEYYKHRALTYLRIGRLYWAKANTDINMALEISKQNDSNKSYINELVHISDKIRQAVSSYIRKSPGFFERFHEVAATNTVNSSISNFGKSF